MFSMHICLPICECAYVCKCECAYFLRPRTGARGCLTSGISWGLSSSASKSQFLSLILNPLHLSHYGHIFIVLYKAVPLGFVTGVLRSAISSSNGPSKCLVSFSLGEKIPCAVLKEEMFLLPTKWLDEGVNFYSCQVGNRSSSKEEDVCTLPTAQCHHSSGALSCLWQPAGGTFFWCAISIAL